MTKSETPEKSILVKPDGAPRPNENAYAAVVTAGIFEPRDYAVPANCPEPSIVLITTEEQYKWIQEGKFVRMAKLQMGIHSTFHDQVDIKECIKNGWIQKDRTEFKPVRLSPTQIEYIEQKTLGPTSSRLSLPSQILYLQNETNPDGGAIHRLFDEVRRLGVNVMDPDETKMAVKHEDLKRVLQATGVTLVPKFTHDYLALRNIYLKPLFAANWVRNINWNKPTENANLWTPLEGVWSPIKIVDMEGEKNNPKYSLTDLAAKPKGSTSSSTAPRPPVAPPPAPARATTTTTTTSGIAHVSTPVLFKSIQLRIVPRPHRALYNQQEDHKLFDKFKKDIRDPAFIQKVLAAEQTFLESKKERYLEFTKLDWSDAFQKVLQENQKRIDARIKVIKRPTQEIIDQKAEALRFMEKSLRSIKQASRLSAITEIIRLVYTFVAFPSFYLTQFMNYLIMGPAGSGKTTLAKVMATTFYALGINLTNKIKYATAQDLIGSFVGQTAIKTRDLLMAQLEGVLFIDEAYGLANCDANGNLKKDQHYGSDAITEMINFIDKFRGCMVVILAGYPHMMNNCLMKSNEGLPRRFHKSIKLPPFRYEELTKILFQMMEQGTKKKKQDLFTPEQISNIRFLVKICATQGGFSNGAGDMENLNQFLIEDYVISGGHALYTPYKIQNTFRKFLATKNMDLNMEDEIIVVD